MYLVQQFTVCSIWLIVRWK